MDLYQNAQETEQAAIALLNTGFYRQAIYFACLATELYLKSKLHLVEHDIDLEASHNTEKLYKALLVRFKPTDDLLPMATHFRKYFNESRYPYSFDASAYTESFTKEFLDYLTAIKAYIDNDCIATIEDLATKHSQSRH